MRASSLQSYQVQASSIVLRTLSQQELRGKLRCTASPNAVQISSPVTAGEAIARMCLHTRISHSARHPRDCLSDPYFARQSASYTKVQSMPNSVDNGFAAPADIGGCATLRNTPPMAMVIDHCAETAVSVVPSPMYHLAGSDGSAVVSSK